MRALLLAAGRGTRLRPITETTPKCLVQVRGRALLDYWLDALCGKWSPVQRTIVNTHHLADDVRRHIIRNERRWTRHGKWIDMVHERALLGTAGTVKENREWLLRQHYDQPFMVIHADNLTDMGPMELLSFGFWHAARPSDCIMSMLAYRTDRPEQSGILEVSEDHVLRGFHEKVPQPPGNLANGAVYICEPEVIDLIAETGATDLSTQIIPRLLGQIYVQEYDGYFRDIGTPEALALANQEFGQ